MSRRRELLEVSLASGLCLLGLGTVLAVGVAGSTQACITDHPGKQVRWQLAGGCEENIAGTWVPATPVDSKGRLS